MDIDYNKCPLQVMWFRRIDGDSDLYLCKEDDCGASLYVTKRRLGKLYNPIIHLGNKHDGLLVKIVAEKKISLLEHSPESDFSYGQIIEEIKKIKDSIEWLNKIKGSDLVLECEAFEIIHERFSRRKERILRLYKFKDL